MRSLVIYNHSVYFNEYANPLFSTLKNSGWEVTLTTTLPLPPDSFYIMFGLLSASVPAPLTPYIAVQLEQETSSFFTPEYIDKLRGAVEVWEFSASTIPFLATHGVKAYHVPLGKVPTPLTPIGVEDIDVVFLGVLNPRRREVLDALLNAGVHVATSDRIFGTVKDELVARARLVLNIHYYPNATLEQLRILPALSTGKLVISEIARDQQPMAEFGATPEEILAHCQRWLRVTPAERQTRALQLLAQIPDFADIVPFGRLRQYCEVEARDAEQLSGGVVDVVKG